MRFRKILCPVDFSEGSNAALAVAVRIANESAANLVIAHAWQLPIGSALPEVALPQDLYNDVLGAANEGLEHAVATARKLGAQSVSSELLGGPPWAEVVQLLEHDAAFDLVIMGTHGRTGVSRILLGSVAEKIVRHAPCSVLAVRKTATDKPFTHVLCPIDFSEHSRVAVEMAVELVRPWGAGITLMHATDLPINYSGVPLPADFLANIDKLASQQLEAWAAELRDQVSLPIVTVSRGGLPTSEVLGMLDEDKTFDLVSVGSHGRTGIRRVLLGSVAETIVRHARCPVLVARHRRAR